MTDVTNYVGAYEAHLKAANDDVARTAAQLQIHKRHRRKLLVRLWQAKWKKAWRGVVMVLRAF